MRYHPNHRDASAKPIIDGLARNGWRSVEVVPARTEKDGSTSGLPDLVVARWIRNHLLELKSIGGTLSASQVRFANAWPGCVHVAETTERALEVLEECEGRTR